MEWQAVILGLVVAAIGSGGVVAFFKLRPEKEGILVASAEKVVILQKGELERLYARLDKLEEKVEHYERAEAEWAAKLDELLDYQRNGVKQYEEVVQERDLLQVRVAELEAQLKEKGETV